MRDSIQSVGINIHTELRGLEDKGMITSEGILSPAAHGLIAQLEIYFSVQKQKTTRQLLGEDFKEKILEFKQHWPKKRIPQGYYVTSTPENLEGAFKWFFTNYNYSWDIIIEATLRYLDEKERDNWNYTMKSQFFVRKQQQDKSWNSELANYCELIISGEEPEDDVNFKDTVFK
jgi:hypothetical protein